MKTNVGSVLCLMSLFVVAGCSSGQAKKTDPIADLTAAQSRLDEKVKLLEMGQGKTDAQISAIDTKLTSLSARLEKVGELPESLAADSAANRAYVKAVSNDLASLRDKTIEVLDLQNRRLVEGRKAYIAVLRREEVLLTEKLKEMSQAISTLEKGLPDAEKEVSSVLSSQKKQQP